MKAVAHEKSRDAGVMALQRGGFIKTSDVPELAPTFGRVKAEALPPLPGGYGYEERKIVILKNGGTVTFTPVRIDRILRDWAGRCYGDFHWLDEGGECGNMIICQSHFLSGCSRARNYIYANDRYWRKFCQELFLKYRRDYLETGLHTIHDFDEELTKHQR
jgi:hypothetical protein